CETLNRTKLWYCPRCMGTDRYHCYHAASGCLPSPAHTVFNRSAGSLSAHFCIVASIFSDAKNAASGVLYSTKRQAPDPDILTRFFSTPCSAGKALMACCIMLAVAASTG